MVAAFMRRAPVEVRQVVALAWTRAARVADVLQLTHGDVSLTADVPPQIRVRWGRDKTHSAAQGAVFVISHRPTVALLRPLAIQQKEVGPLFRLTTRQVAAWLPGYGAHALRRGALQHLERRGWPNEELAKLARHRRSDTTLVYTAGVDAAQRARSSAAATVLGEAVALMS